MTDTFYSTISEMVEKFRRKEVSPVEVVNAYCERAERLQTALNAFVHLDRESALARAQQAEARYLRAQASPPLSGIPLSVKSNIDVAGWTCPTGSLLRKDYVPSTNAPLVRRLEGAGGILLGNTNTPEFLMAYETDNRVSGRTSNPWNLAYSSGGSSGGEAAAIASGCSMGGVGSDGGGSIRVPAHFCGICGLKPTPGRIPSTGHFPPPGGAFTWIGAVGPMARTVADLQLLFQAMTGPDADDPLSAPVPFRIDTGRSAKDMRIGILQSSALGTATSETQEAVDRAGKLLADFGFQVEPFPMKKLDDALRLWWFFFGPVIGMLLRQSFQGKESLMSPMLAGFLEVVAADEPVTLESFMSACEERDAVRSNIIKQMQDVPVLVSPVSSAPAFRHGEGNYRAGDVHNYRDTMRYCQWLNLAGLPGLSLPMSKSANGLPINVQLIGQPWNEEVLLQVGQILEQERGGWQAPPIQ